jgi:DNA polymerase-3 subunit alpha
MRAAAFAQTSAASDQIDIFGAGTATRTPEPLRLPSVVPWLPAEKLHREFTAVGFYLSAHPLDAYKTVLERMRVQNWAEFALAVKRGASAGRLAGTVTSKQERKTRTGNKMGVVQFSDVSGQYEAVLFSETLAQYRDLFEPGASVVVTVSAEDRPEGISLRIQSAQALDAEASRLQQAMRIYLRDDRPLDALSNRLGGRGEGQVSLIVIKDGGAGEIEVELPNRYQLNPRIAAAIKAVPGVVDVELV